MDKERDGSRVEEQLPRVFGLWLLADAIGSLIIYRKQSVRAQLIRGIRALIGFLLLTGGK